MALGKLFDPSLLWWRLLRVAADATAARARLRARPRSPAALGARGVGGRGGHRRPADEREPHRAGAGLRARGRVRRHARPPGPGGSDGGARGVLAPGRRRDRRAGRRGDAARPVRGLRSAATRAASLRSRGRAAASPRPPAPPGGGTSPAGGGSPGSAAARSAAGGGSAVARPHRGRRRPAPRGRVPRGRRARPRWSSTRRSSSPPARARSGTRSWSRRAATARGGGCRSRTASAAATRRTSSRGWRRTRRSSRSSSPRARRTIGLFVLGVGAVIYYVSRADLEHAQGLLVVERRRGGADPAEARRSDRARRSCSRSGRRIGRARCSGRPTSRRSSTCASRRTSATALPARHRRVQRLVPPRGADLRRAAPVGPRDLLEPAPLLPHRPPQRPAPRLPPAGQARGAAQDRRARCSAARPKVVIRWLAPESAKPEPNRRGRPSGSTALDDYLATRLPASGALRRLRDPGAAIIRPCASC